MAARRARVGHTKIDEDECKDWSNKAHALASYARQARDKRLMNMAVKIRARAIRRTGELLKETRASKGGRPKLGPQGTLVSRKGTAEDAGLSDRERKTALRVASVPDDEFESLVEREDPASVKEIAAAEAAEQYFARAKDPQGLMEAVELKLTEQRNFVLWWDGQEKQHGKLGSRSGTQFAYLDKLGADKKTVHRWRRRLADEIEQNGLAIRARTRGPV